MNREIKFRVWNSRKNFVSYQTKLKKPGRLEEMVYFELGDMDEDLIIKSMSYVDKDTVVMQYTGLKDKNGQEVYEGDIVRCHFESSSISHNYMGKKTIGSEWQTTEEINEVKWGSYGDGEYVSDIECWMWNNHPLSDYIQIPSEYETSYWSYRNRFFEVIGNIYENPELLKQNS